jgi:hypothetical protein
LHFTKEWEQVTSVLSLSFSHSLILSFSHSHLHFLGLGISESVLQFVLYERIKHFVQKQNHDRYNKPLNAPLGAIQNLVVASIAKFIASLATYPHEVCSFSFLFFIHSFTHSHSHSQSHYF